MEIFFTDRFGFGTIDNSIIHPLYIGCNSLRIKMWGDPQMISRGAREQHERINKILEIRAF